MMTLSFVLACALGPPVGVGMVPDRLTGDESQVAALYRIGREPFPVVTYPLRATAGYHVRAVRYPSPLPSGDPVNDWVYAELFWPVRTQPRAAVVVLHILGADFALSRYYAARLADQGVAALFMQMPYYGHRRAPARPETRFLSADIERTTQAMRQAVCDVRRAILFLADQPGIDRERLGVTGISLGGIVAALAAAVDPAVREAVILFAGGQLGTVLWEMPEGEARRYRQAWIDAGRGRTDLEVLTRPFDPLTYAQGLRGKRLLFIAGSVDEVIPPPTVQALWDAAGQPPILWYPCGHYSAAGFVLPAVRRCIAFFARTELEAE